MTAESLAPDEPMSNAAASTTGDEPEDGVFRGIAPELLAEYARLTAKDVPIPDDPVELEAQIREIDRVQAAIAEQLRARSLVAESEVRNQVSERGDVKRRT